LFFSGCNALSFQIVLSSPMVLFAKSLGASATVLGIISGMMPLLVVFQIPAANHIPRFGYKAFVLAGWSIRVMFIFLIALVPLVGAFLAAGSQMALLLFLLFCFNLSRGISSCAWLPWITSLIPEDLRGRYLVRDAGFVNVASFVTLSFAAITLGRSPAPWQFTTVFLFSAMTGSLSLYFLRRIPDATMPEQARVSNTPVPWREIAAFPPFRKLLRMNVTWAIAYGGLSAFTVAFLKTEAGMGDRGILFAVAASYLGGLSSLALVGPRIDRLGSKPVIGFAMAVWLVIVSVWTALAGGALPTTRPIVIGLQWLMGLAAALVQMSNTRLAMATIPSLGRSHFFALFSVVGNLSLGVAPVVWGLVIDGLKRFESSWHGWQWNRFTFFFILVGCAFMVAAMTCRKLDEPKAVRMEELLRELFVASPLRVWVRLWPRS
jgi:MFS family permease